MFKMLKKNEKNYQYKILHPLNLSFKSEGKKKKKTLSKKQKLSNCGKR